MSPTIFFSVGEPSGDLHAAKLVDCLREQDASIQTIGLGGSRMQQSGCQVIYPLTDLAVVGFVEVLPKLREFFRVADLASACMDAHRPDAVVLVDFPGFNWHIAKRAKQRGIPVVYYLPPQLWAWGSWRLRKMRRYVDHVLCNLPFEQQWYEQRGMNAYYVGHPFFDEVQQRKLDQCFIKQWYDERLVNVAILPGSRSREVHTIWPIQLEAIRRVHRQHSQVQFHVACLKPEHLDFCKQQLVANDAKLPINFFVNNTSEVLEMADCALSKSGSVSLELMAREVPSVIVYQLGWLTYQIARRLTNINSITLPNFLAGTKVMDEFLAVGSPEPTIGQVVAALVQLIRDPELRAKKRNELSKLSRLYAQPGATQTAAELILSLTGNAHVQPPRRQAA